ncbi:Leucine-rich repeat receptor-like serine/threonine-protein kinase BAM1 [Platanthera guangdongensis]|uniref:Leucine-rich repeat receptor-like serine/threonine-protein kinase BAM1 n=1 Tax=Platanthera guangdongensis TaxID=2320717 RepID=A0ABR2M4M4_9ASPA
MLCVADQSVERPTMREVVQILTDLPGPISTPGEVESSQSSSSVEAAGADMEGANEGKQDILPKTLGPTRRELVPRPFGPGRGANVLAQRKRELFGTEAWFGRERFRAVRAWRSRPTAYPDCGFSM